MTDFTPDSNNEAPDTSNPRGSSSKEPYMGRLDDPQTYCKLGFNKATGGIWIELRGGNLDPRIEKVPNTFIGVSIPRSLYIEMTELVKDTLSKKPPEEAPKKTLEERVAALEERDQARREAGLESLQDHWRKGSDALTAEAH